MQDVLNLMEYSMNLIVLSVKYMLFFFETTDVSIFFRFDKRDLMVTLGDHDRQSKDRFGNIEVRGIRSVRKHEHFDIGTYNNDIAILEMDVPVSFNDKMNPVCLPNYGKIFCFLN